MAIHPEYAEAILVGAKKVEFRKRPLARDIEEVLIYATSPVQKIVGSFSIADIVSAKPPRLWESYADVGCIEHKNFDDYYSTTDLAYGILVADVVRFEPSVPLSALSPVPAIPQSFAYLDYSRVQGVWPDRSPSQVGLFDESDALANI